VESFESFERRAPNHGYWQERGSNQANRATGKRRHERGDQYKKHAVKGLAADSQLFVRMSRLWPGCNLVFDDRRTHGRDSDRSSMHAWSEAAVLQHRPAQELVRQLSFRLDRTAATTY
jgi:hypothetical protein